jgi:hypothetical protein
MPQTSSTGKNPTRQVCVNRFAEGGRFPCDFLTASTLSRFVHARTHARTHAGTQSVSITGRHRQSHEASDLVSWTHTLHHTTLPEAGKEGAIGIGSKT